MKVEIIDNLTRKLKSVLAPSIEQAREIRIAVAFVSQSGLDLIEAPMQSALRTGATIEFLVGLDMHTTEAAALQSLYELSCANEYVSLYCYSSSSRGSIYHPKLYLFKSEDAATSIIGSSNLTSGGLQKNREVNVLLEGTILDEAISDSFAAYSELKLDPNRTIPDDEYVRLYGEVSRAVKKVERKAKSDEDFQDLLTRLNEKAKSLKRPQRNVRDLYGWQRLVYEALPDDIFY
jgi:HKD family nuclease